MCHNTGKRNHYKNDPDAKTKNKISREEYRKRNRIFVYNYLTQSKCVDCGDTRWQVLDFDHVRGQKIRAISIMVHEQFSIENIKEEIAKCEVRCSNCHRVKTSEQLNYYPYLKKID